MVLKIAIVGSREFQDRGLFEEKMKKIFEDKTDKEVITGDASGIDSWVKNFCVMSAIKCEVVAPIDPTKKINFLYRNIEIITKADKVIAFWDGHSKGTKFVIEYTRARNKPIEIYVEK